MRSAPIAIGMTAVFDMSSVEGLQPASQGQPAASATSDCQIMKYKGV